MADTNKHINIDEVLEEYFTLKDEVQDLKTENVFLRRQNAACKLRYAEFSKRVRELEEEIADLRFTHKYLTAEEAGKAFARELLGKPMTEEDLAIEAGENGYEPYTGDDF